MADKEKNADGPVHVMEIRDIHGQKEFFNKYDVIDSILLQPEVKDRKIVILSVIGEYRKGKSFLLDYCLRYMHANYASVSKMSKPVPSKNWLGDGNDPLKGFSWKHGFIADTKGILFWPDVFLHDTESGEKIAIIIMDTQGLFEIGSTQEENARIFGLSTLISSIQIINVKCIIHEGLIEYLETATSLTKVIAQKQVNSESEWKAFQKLLFLIRDWSYEEVGFGYSGGATYLKEFLNTKNRQDTKAQAIRKAICDSFDSLDCFLLNSPGSIVTSSDFNGEWSRLEEDFVDNLKILVESILSPQNLKVKSFLGKEVNASEFRNLLFTYFDIFRDTKIPEIENIFQMTVDNQMKAIVDEQLKAYQTDMNKDIDMDQEDFESWIQTKHENCKKETIFNFFAAEKLSDDTIDEKYQKILEDDIEASYKSWSSLVLSKYHAFATAKREIMELGTENANYIEKVNQLNFDYQNEVLEGAKLQQDHEEKVRKEAEREVFLRRQLLALEQSTKDREEEIRRIKREEQEMEIKFQEQLKKQEEEHIQTMLLLEAELNREKQIPEKSQIHVFASKTRGKNDINTKKDSHPTNLSCQFTPNTESNLVQSELLKQKHHLDVCRSSESVSEHNVDRKGLEDSIQECKPEITPQQDQETPQEVKNGGNCRDQSIDSKLEEENMSIVSHKNVIHEKLTERNDHDEASIESNKPTPYNDSSDNFCPKTNENIEVVHTPDDYLEKQWINKFETMNQIKIEYDEQLRIQNIEHERQMEILRLKLRKISEEPIKEMKTIPSSSSQNKPVKIDNGHSSITRIEGNKCEQEIERNVLSDQFARRNLGIESSEQKLGYKESKREKEIDEEETLEEKLDREFKDAEKAFELMKELKRLMMEFDQTIKHLHYHRLENLRLAFPEISELKDKLEVLQVYDKEIKEEQDRFLQNFQQWSQSKVKMLPSLRSNDQNHQQPIGSNSTLQDMQFVYIMDVCDQFKQDFNKFDDVNKILLHPEIKDRKIVIVSVVDEGFLLDCCLRFMYANYHSLSRMEGRSAHFKGYIVNHGYKDSSIGILLWPDVFLYETSSGEKVAIIFVNTQRLFLMGTTDEENAKIFSLSALISSIQVINKQIVTKEKKKNFYKTVSNLNEERNLVCVKSNTIKWLTHWVKSNDEKIKGIFEYGSRKTYNVSFESTKSSLIDNNKRGSLDQISCTMCTTSGNGTTKKDISDKFQGKGDFDENLEWLISVVLSPENLVKISILGRKLTCAEYRGLLLGYMNELEGANEFKMKQIFQVPIKTLFQIFMVEQLETYQSEMKKDITFNEHNLNAMLNEKHGGLKWKAILLLRNTFHACGTETLSRLITSLENEIDIRFRSIKKSLLHEYETKHLNNIAIEAIEVEDYSQFIGVSNLNNDYDYRRKNCQEEKRNKLEGFTKTLGEHRLLSTESNHDSSNALQQSVSGLHNSFAGYSNTRSSPQWNSSAHFVPKPTPTSISGNRLIINPSELGMGSTFQFIEPPNSNGIPHTEASPRKTQSKKLGNFKLKHH